MVFNKIASSLLITNKWVLSWDEDRPSSSSAAVGALTLKELRVCPSWPWSPRSPAAPSSDTPPAARWSPPETQRGHRWGSVRAANDLQATSGRPHQLVHLHQLLLLLVQLAVLHLQHHLEALQLLLQVQRVGILLQTERLCYLWGPAGGSRHTAFTSNTTFPRVPSQIWILKAEIIISSRQKVWNTKYDPIFHVLTP